MRLAVELKIGSSGIWQLRYWSLIDRRAHSAQPAWECLPPGQDCRRHLLAFVCVGVWRVGVCVRGDVMSNFTTPVTFCNNFAIRRAIATKVA